MQAKQNNRFTSWSHSSIRHVSPSLSKPKYSASATRVCYSQCTTIRTSSLFSWGKICLFLSRKINSTKFLQCSFKTKSKFLFDMNTRILNNLTNHIIKILNDEHLMDTIKDTTSLNHKWLLETHKTLQHKFIQLHK